MIYLEVLATFGVAFVVLVGIAVFALICTKIEDKLK